MNRATTVCDGCNRKFYQDELHNIHDDYFDLTEDYQQIDGMYCRDCMKKMVLDEYNNDKWLGDANSCLPIGE